MIFNREGRTAYSILYTKILQLLTLFTFSNRDTFTKIYIKWERIVDLSFAIETFSPLERENLIECIANHLEFLIQKFF